MCLCALCSLQFYLTDTIYYYCCTAAVDTRRGERMGKYVTANIGAVKLVAAVLLGQSISVSPYIQQYHLSNYLFPVVLYTV